MSDRCLEFDYGTCVSSEFKEKRLLIGVDLMGADGSGRGAESIQPLGILFRPRDPDPGDAESAVGAGAGALYAHLGDELFALPTTDPRFIDKVPQVKKGGGVIYSAPGAFIYIDGDDGTTQIFVPYDDGGTARTMAFTINAKDKCINVVHGKGHGIHILNDDKSSVIITNKTGNATLAVDDDGIKGNGNVTMNGGLVAGDPTSAVPLATFPDLATFAAQVTAALTTLAGAAGGTTIPPITAPTTMPTPTTKASASP